MMRAVRPRGLSTRTGTPHRELFWGGYFPCCFGCSGDWGECP